MAERLREIEDEVGTGGEDSEEKPDLLSFLLKNTSWGPSKVVDNAVDLLGAGIDTVCMPSRSVFTGRTVLHRHRFTHTLIQCLFKTVTFDGTHTPMQCIFCVPSVPSYMSCKPVYV